MTIQLNTNRYQTLTPSATLPNGVIVSCPFYIQITSDQAKTLLNAFRSIRTQQAIEDGLIEETITPGGITVKTQQPSRLTQVEQAMGMSEDALRQVLFARGGIQERVLIKLCHLTGIELVSAAQVQQTYELWLNHIFKTTNEDLSTKPADQTSKPTKTRSRKAATSVAK